jgi:hypothetical protein
VRGICMHTYSLFIFKKYFCCQCLITFLTKTHKQYTLSQRLALQYCYVCLP